VIRRSFRIGLTLGLLGGLAFALVKMFGARPGPETASAPDRDEPWPRLTTDPAVPAAAEVLLVPDPAAPSPVAPIVDEAVIEPVPKPGPAKPAPAKKAAAKKAAAKKGPAKKAAAKRAAPVKAWVDPDGGVCPTSHPVKAKLASKIFHLPGMLNYDRTNPDRCYLDAGKAEADGLRAAKR
jgi:hypothetical protein